MISIVACCHGAKLCAHAARGSDRNTILRYTLIHTATSSRLGPVNWAYIRQAT